MSKSKSRTVSRCTPASPATTNGFEYIEAALASSNRKLIVVDQDEVKDDIVRDLHEIIVSLCSRLYGKRSAERRAKKAVEALA